MILLLEHKTPGTLEKDDWTGGLPTDKRLRGKAIPTAKQSRKYVSASGLRLNGIYDSCTIVGLCMRAEDEDHWNTITDSPA